VKTILILLALAGTARAAIEHDVDVESGGPILDQQIAFDVTVAPGDGRYALVSIDVMGTAARVVAARIDGTAFSFINSAEAVGGGCRTEWWGLRDPPVGAHTVTVNLAADTPTGGATFISYRGVDERRPLGALVSASGMLPPSEVILSARPDALVLDNVCGWGPASVIMTAGGGQTARWHWSMGSFSTAGSDKAAASNVSLTWTAGGDRMMAWAATGLVLNPAGPPPPTTSFEIGTTGCAAAGRPGGGAWWLPAMLVAVRRAGRRFREHRRRSPV
jgi:hypothetical protein